MRRAQKSLPAISPEAGSFCTATPAARRKLSSPPFEKLGIAVRGEKRTPKKVNKSGSIAGLLKRGWTLIRAYPYQDETGALLYENVRLEITVAGKRSKTFRQRRPRESAGYVENLDGVRRVPYRLKEFLDAPGQEIHVPEGEKDADRLAAMGL